MTQSKIASASSHNPNDLLKQRNAFPDLRSGGRELSRQLESSRDIPDRVVLGIALGGLPVAHEVATHLQAPLDFVIIRRLLQPDGPGSDICAVNAAGTLIIDDRIRASSEPATPVEHYINAALTELETRAQTCRAGRAPLALEGRTVILVDCGIRTGSTMRAALIALRKLKPTRIIGAAPVASREGYAAIVSLCDDLISLSQPEIFVNAGYWYRDFRRPGDDQVGELLT
jgi:putative phosphoribosyl transferase